MPNIPPVRLDHQGPRSGPTILFAQTIFTACIGRSQLTI